MSANCRRQKNKQETTRPPKFVEAMIERACAQDREYFKQHPDAQSYIRQIVPGEAWPVILPEGTLIMVNQISPGFRLRSFFEPGGGANGQT